MSRKGFTLIELVIVIVILGILASIAIPKFLDMSADAKEAACKGALGGVRSGIASFYAYKSTPSGGGAAAWPTLVELETASTVIEGSLPSNPYSTASTAAGKIDARAGVTKGTPVTGGTTGAWCYLSTTGEFWADTASGAGEAGF